MFPNAYIKHAVVMTSKSSVFVLFCLLIACSNLCFALPPYCAFTHEAGLLPPSSLDSESKSFSVWCNQFFDTGGWTVVFNRDDGSVNFHNRTWQEYREGFGTPDGDYFLGLDKLHALTASRRHELAFMMFDLEGQLKVAKYSYLNVDDAGYSFYTEVGEYYVDAGFEHAGDGFIYTNSFCSFDRGCKDRLSGWNKRDGRPSYLFAEHWSNVPEEDRKNATVMCWQPSYDDECITQISITMLVRPVNIYLAQRPSVK